MDAITQRRWRRIEALLDGALDLPPGRRDAWLREACAGDGVLLEQVVRLLEASERPGPTLDRPALALLTPTAGLRAHVPPERVGPFRLVRELGRGGMGTVHLAEREEFAQTVALKLVRPGFELDRTLVRRFLEERAILASLEHPNIARLVDGGVTADGLPWFAMEYVDGEPIDAWCDARRLAVDRRLALVRQACRAVGYAHRRHVVHRDLKPSNILVTADGTPKLLDFGIAKLLGPERADATVITRTGMRLLTPAYASPEQVRGDPVTPASDVYAIGVLLYELLAGGAPYAVEGRALRAFERAILEQAPARPSAAAARASDDVAVRRGTTPGALARRLRGDVDAIVLQALRKEPGRRYPTADALAEDLERYLAGHPVAARPDAWGYRLARLAHRHRVSVMAASVGLLVGVTAIVVLSARAMDRAAAERSVPGAARRVAFDAALEIDPAISPDGARVAYVAERDGVLRLHVRAVAGGPAQPLAEFVPGAHRAPRWSPDGREIAFQAGRAIHVVAVAGGPSRVLVAPEPGARWVAWLAWSPDGRTIAYVQDWLIHVRPAAGGASRRLGGIPGEPHSLAWSPDGRRLALVHGNEAFVSGDPGPGAPTLGNIAPSAVWVVPVAGDGAARPVTDQRTLDTSPVWMPDGRSLLFVSNRDGDRDVYRATLDDEGAPVGEPARVTAGLGAHTISLSRDGRRLAYSVFRNVSNVWALPIPARGPVSDSAARPVTTGRQSIEGFGVSPDGRWLAYDSDRNGNQDLFKVALAGGEPVQVTASRSDEFLPAWSPDGREIAFQSFAGGVRRVEVVPADGGASRPVAARPRGQRYPGWSPDGRSLVFSTEVPTGASGPSQLWVVTRRADGGWRAARQVTRDGGAAARWSPDGRRIVYARGDGLWTIAPDGTDARRVLRVDGTSGAPGTAHWAPDGRTIYFKWIDADGRASIRAVPADARDGAPRVLVRLEARRSPRLELATDGRRFYFTVAERESDVWTMELTPGERSGRR